MPRTAPPLLEGSRFAWIATLVSAGTAVGLVLAQVVAPWLAGLLHVVLLSLVAWFVYAWDKRRARADGRRISEANLLWLAALGGAAGAWIAMVRQRHKTKRRTFRLLVPVCVLLHVAAVAWLGMRSA